MGGIGEGRKDPSKKQRKEKDIAPNGGLKKNKKAVLPQQKS